MEKNEEKKKESALNINDDFDFNFAKKLPGALRWVLVIPAGILGSLAVQLAYGFVVGMLLKNVPASSIVATIVNAIFGFAKFYIFTIAMVGMAPIKTKNKFKAGLGLSVVPFAVAVGTIFILINTDYLFSTTDAAIQIAIVVLATIAALAYIRMDINKEKETVEIESESN